MSHTRPFLKRSSLRRPGGRGGASGRSGARLGAVLLTGALSACVTGPSLPGAQAPGRVADTAGSAARVAERTVVEGAPAAVEAPLEDLNLVRKPIPAALAAVDYVYAAEPELTCAQIAREVRALSAVLGRDYDADEEEGRSLGEKGGEAAGDYVIDTVRGAATGWIPYRGLVREASGAARRDRKVARAFTAGHARRAYLKGVGLGMGCPPPGAPLRTTAPLGDEDRETIEMRGRTERRDTSWGGAVVAPPTAQDD